ANRIRHRRLRHDAALSAAHERRAAPDARIWQGLRNHRAPRDHGATSRVGDRRTTEPLKRVGATALGVITGLVLLEAMLRPLASVQFPPPPDIARDVLGGPLI